MDQKGNELPTVVCPKCGVGFATGRLHKFFCPNEACGHVWKAVAETDLRAVQPDMRVPVPQLVVTRGAEKGTAFDIPDGRSFLGRHSEASVRLGDPTVSRRHAALVRKGHRAGIQAVGEPDTLLVNGKPTSKTELRVGDTIVVGDTALSFRVRFAPRSVGDEARREMVAGASTRKLRVKVSGKEASSFSTDAPRITLGRESSRDVQLLSPHVSRKHAVITTETEGTFLSDSGSRSGTFVNGEAVLKTKIEDDDEVQIGPFLLAYKGGNVTWVRNVLTE